jgi:hypothetical protein
MHKSVTVVVVALLLLALTTAGFCQYNTVGLSAASATARWMGMGGTGIAVANDEGAIDFNPANLATMHLGAPSSDDGTAWEGSLTWGDSAFNELSEKLGVVKPSAGWGAAVSYEHASEAGYVDGELAPQAFEGFTDDIVEAGYAHTVCHGLSVGASFIDWSGQDQSNLGALYAFPLFNCLPPARVGLVWQNVFTQNDEPGILNGGLSLPVAPGLTVASDVYDITKDAFPFATVGAEYCMKDGVSLRAGDYRGEFAAGAGYKVNQWRWDVAYNEFPDHWFNEDNPQQWTVTGSVRF